MKAILTQLFGEAVTEDTLKQFNAELGKKFVAKADYNSKLEEIKGLAEAGYQEFVLTGIHISSYGVDFKKAGVAYDDLLSLMQAIDKLEGVKRLRLGSLEPRVITEEFAKGIGALEHICPHFHLSLQSGCEETLKRMNRHYTPEQFLAGVELLRQTFEHPAITTDVIVGFPGETEEEFEITRAFLEKVSFYEMHVFKYSKRKGTRAAVMENQIPEPVKTQRSNVLIAMDEKDTAVFREYYLGKNAEVLFEEKKEISGQQYWIGHTKEYVKAALADDGQDYTNCLVKGILTQTLNKEVLLLERREA